MKIKKIILKTTLFICIWILAASFLIGIFQNYSFDSEDKNVKRYEESEYFKENYLACKLETLNNMYDTKKWLDSYDKDKIQFTLINYTDDTRSDISVNELKSKYKDEYDDIDMYDSSISDEGKLAKLFKGSEILAIPTRDYLSIFYKYAEKNRKKINNKKEQDNNKDYNNITYYDSDEDDSYDYGWINDEVSDSAMIFQKNDKMLVYSDEEELYYNNYVGWIDSSDIDDSEYLYIPVSYIDNSSTEENKEQSILIAPFLTSLEDVFRCQFQEYLDNTQWYSNYKRMLNTNNTSFRYAIYNGDGKLEVTNDEDIDFSKCIISTVYDTSSKSDSQKIFNSKCIKELKDIDKGKKITIGIIKTDKNLQYDYNINLQRRLFSLYQYSSIARVVFFIDIFVVIAIIAYLIKNELKVDKIYKFDKIPVEIGAGLSVISIIILIALMYNLVYYYSNGLSCAGYGIILSALYTIPCYILNMECLMSLIRRLRNHKFIDTTIIAKIYRVIKKTVLYIWRNRSISSRKIIRLIMYNVINIICLLLIICGIETGIITFIGLILMIVFNIYAFRRIVDDTKNMGKILDVAKDIADGNLNAKINIDELYDDKKELGERINSIGDGLQKAVETSIKDEKLKSELITNVSHDIKTPLTSIINYIDLIKREDIQDEKLQEYLKVLDMKSQRLKQLTEDLVEVSKASTGNIELERAPLNIKELLTQSVAEFSEKFESKNLQLISNITEDNLVIYADGRRCFRIIENLLQNIYKYAMERSRVYLDVYKEEDKIVLSLKNISEMPLNIDSNELTERFVRGDVSRTTEGSGLGLSIAKNLVELQDGEFNVVIDGDLFKVIIKFKEFHE